jgi:PleD family two-component response regulator
MYKKMIDPSQYHIMIVDESPGSLKSYHSVLCEAGFQVSSSLEPKYPLTGIESGIYDLVLFSVSTLESCVFMAIKLCRDLAHQKNIPIIVLSSMDRQTLYASYFVDGVDYIQKPMLSSELIMRVGMWAKQCACIKNLTQQINTRDQLTYQSIKTRYRT